MIWRGILALALVVATGLPAAGRLAPPAMAGSLPFFYDLYTFRGEGGGTLVVAAVAVAAGDLEPEERDDDVRYRFDVTLVLADTALRSVSRTDDSVYVVATRELRDEHLLYTHIDVHARPSMSTVQRVIVTDATTPGIGQLYDSSFPIPDYSGRDLMISDIALGDPDPAAGWTRGDVTLALLPTSQFPESAFDVYYEIYNLPYGTPYTTEILVQPLDDSGAPLAGDDRAVGLRFAGEADTRRDGTLQELRRVTASLERGRYRLTVIITNQETGETATRSRVFRVRGWAPGATLIAALPR